MRRRKGREKEEEEEESVRVRVTVTVRIVKGKATKGRDYVMDGWMDGKMVKSTIQRQKEDKTHRSSSSTSRTDAAAVNWARALKRRTNQLGEKAE